MGCNEPVIANENNYGWGSTEENPVVRKIFSSVRSLEGHLDMDRQHLVGRRKMNFAKSKERVVAVSGNKGERIRSQAT